MFQYILSNIGPNKLKFQVHFSFERQKTLRTFIYRTSNIHINTLTYRNSYNGHRRI